MKEFKTLIDSLTAISLTSTLAIFDELTSKSKKQYDRNNLDLIFIIRVPCIKRFLIIKNRFEGAFTQFRKLRIIVPPLK